MQIKIVRMSVPLHNLNVHGRPSADSDKETYLNFLPYSNSFDAAFLLHTDTRRSRDYVSAASNVHIFAITEPKINGLFASILLLNN